MPAEIIEVVAYSGYRVEECPRFFIIRGEQIEVIRILNMWIEENVKTKNRKRFFHVRGSDTTAISLETGKGEVALSLALGFILVALALIITVLANRFLRVKEADVAQSRAPTS